MKAFVKSLALLLALITAFGISASASDLPDDLDLNNLPELTLGVTVSGVIAISGSIVAQGETWYRFTPPEDGYYAFPTTGGYDNGWVDGHRDKNGKWVDGGLDYFLIRPSVYDADGNLYFRREPKYKAGETLYVSVGVAATDETKTQAEYTVTPKRYTYTEPLTPQGYTEAGLRGKKLSSMLAGSGYSIADIELLDTRGNIVKSTTYADGDMTFYQPDAAGGYYAGHIDLYFRDGTYTTITADNKFFPGSSDIDGFLKGIRDFFARIGNFFARIRSFFSNLSSKFIALFKR